MRAKKILKCKYCDKKIANVDGLNQHVVKVHGIKDVPCQHCDKKVANLKGLEQHVSAVHFKIKLVQNSRIAGQGVKERNSNENRKCERCGKIFPTRGEMLTHNVLIHSRGIKPSCGKCGKEFIFENACRKHEFQCQKHTAIKAGEITSSRRSKIKEEPIEIVEESPDVKNEPSKVHQEPIQVDEEPVEIKKELFDKDELFTRKISFCPLCDVRGWSEDKIREHLQEFHKARSDIVEVRTM